MSPYGTGSVPSGTHGGAPTSTEGEGSSVVNARSNGASMLPVHTAAAPRPIAARLASTAPKITACRSRLRRRRSLRCRAASAAAAARASGSIVTGRNGSRSRGRARGRLMPELEDPRVQQGALLERGPHRAVQAVLEVHRPLPPHDVREQVAVEGRVVREQMVEVEGPLGRHELVEAYLRRGDLGPAGRGVEVVLGVRPTVSHTLEDHAASVGRGRAALAGGTPAVRDPVPQSPRGRAAAGGMSPSRRTTAPGRLRYLLAM